MELETTTKRMEEKEEDWVVENLPTSKRFPSMSSRDRGETIIWIWANFLTSSKLTIAKISLSYISESMALEDVNENLLSVTSWAGYGTIDHFCAFIPSFMLL